MTGIKLMTNERREQIEKHGRTVEHDVRENKNGELLMGAQGLIDHKYALMPDEWSRAGIDRMMAKPYVDRLVIAGAFIAAEIDRLKYKKKSSVTDNDMRNYNNIPDSKWFEEIDVWPSIKRAYYSLRRLIDAGMVESKVKGNKIVYRKIKTK